MFRIFITSFFISFFIFCSAAKVTAQNTKEKVKSFFPTEEEVEWVRFFRGRMNDINDVMIALGSNGKEYRGVMKFFRSNEIFHVMGRVNGAKLVLMEQDTFGNMTGMIKGTIDDFEGIKAEWQNFNNTLGGNMSLIPYPNEPQYPTYCGDNKWIRLYEGKIGEEVVDFILARGTHFRVNGLAYFRKQNRSYLVEGELSNYNRDIELEIETNNFEIIGKIKGRVDFKTDSIAGTFTDTKKRTFDCSIHKGATLAVGCIEYADFYTEMEVTYPKTRNIKFNEMLTAYIDEWLNTSRKYTSQYREQMQRPTPPMRASLRSYFWCDVEYFSEDLMSGVATHTNTWEDGYQGYAFNFDFKNNQPITLESLFDENSKYKSFLRQYIQKEMEKRPFYSDKVFQQWVRSAKFEHFTIRREGLNFVSEFNSIFGKQHCTIPYEALQPFLKKGNVISFLYEK